VTFVVSEGISFGEGPVGLMLQETLAGPVIRTATALLVSVVETAANPPPNAS